MNPIYTEIAMSVFSMMALGHVQAEKAIKIAVLQAQSRHAEQDIKWVEETLKAKLKEWGGL